MKDDIILNNMFTENLEISMRADNLSKQNKLLKKQLRVTHKSYNPSRFTDISKSLINGVYFVGRDGQ